MTGPSQGARPLRLGTRKSAMAMAQSQQVARLITERAGRDVELIGITTFGDVSRAQLAQIGGTGVFVSGLRTSLLHGDVDIAVHSLKDLPTAQPEGIVLAAVPPRDDPRDALVARDGAKLADLPQGARIGTGSPRRAAQVSLLRADVTCVPIRGNANTRLAKVRDGELDAVVLAYAGLARIGFTDLVTEIFGTEEMLPAPGQGALAVECRAEDGELIELLATVDHPATRAAVVSRPAIRTAISWSRITLASRVARARLCRKVKSLSDLERRSSSEMGRESVRSMKGGVKACNASPSGDARLYWNCVRLTRSSTVRSWTGCM